MEGQGMEQMSYLLKDLADEMQVVTAYGEVKLC